MLSWFKLWMIKRKDQRNYLEGYRWAHNLLTNGWASPRTIQLTVPYNNEDYKDGAIQAMYDAIEDGVVGDDTL